MRHAIVFRSFSAALGFFTDWPDQARAAQLVLAQASGIDGNLYHPPDPAARLIEGKRPLAATLLLWRAMVEDTLDGEKSTRHKHAARHLLERRSLAAGIRDFRTFGTDEAFVGRLRARHGRKIGFWSRGSEVSGDRNRSCGLVLLPVASPHTFAVTGSPCADRMGGRPGLVIPTDATTWEGPSLTSRRRATACSSR